MDKNSKIRISFNLFDIIIILIVIALVAGFAVYQTRSSSSGGASGTKTVQYQVGSCANAVKRSGAVRITRFSSSRTSQPISRSFAFTASSA